MPEVVVPNFINFVEKPLSFFFLVSFPELLFFSFDLTMTVHYLASLELFLELYLELSLELSSELKIPIPTVI